jgi:hypothetical protein
MGTGTGETTSTLDRTAAVAVLPVEKKLVAAMKRNEKPGDGTNKMGNKMPYKNNYTPEYREQVTLWVVQRKSDGLYWDAWCDGWGALQEAMLSGEEDLLIMVEGHGLNPDEIQLVRLVAEVRGIKQLAAEPTDK